MLHAAIAACWKPDFFMDWTSHPQPNHRAINFNAKLHRIRHQVLIQSAQGNKFYFKHCIQLLFQSVQPHFNAVLLLHTLTEVRSDPAAACDGAAAVLRHCQRSDHPGPRRVTGLRHRPVFAEFRLSIAVSFCSSVVAETVRPDRRRRSGGGPRPPAAPPRAPAVGRGRVEQTRRRYRASVSPATEPESPGREPGRTPGGRVSGGMSDRPAGRPIR
eukprot:761551-Hanusia_phi.AAC.7